MQPGICKVKSFEIVNKYLMSKWYNNDGCSEGLSEWCLCFDGCSEGLGELCQCFDGCSEGLGELCQCFNIALYEKINFFLKQA